MTPHRLRECLSLIRWGPSTLTDALNLEDDRVAGWLSGTHEIPTKIASWLEALCFTHESAELLKPGFIEGRPTHRQIERAEHVPVYSYNLVRALSRGPVALATLFGTDDEAAVFFLVSRGLAERSGPLLEATPAGRKIGEVVPQHLGP